jgi:hypothetical protein
MAKLARRKDIKNLHASHYSLANTLADHGAMMVTIRRELERLPLWPEVDRIETLLAGVKVNLERMGGNVLPGVVGDIHALRDQMAEFRRELAEYRRTLMKLTNWFDGYDEALKETEVTSKFRNYPEPKPKTKPKRAYNRRKKGNEEDKPQVEISSLDVAPHNDQSEAE